MKLTKTVGGRERGSAVLIVIVLLGLMTLLLVSNSRALNQLKTSLRLIEQKQLKQSAAPFLKTNDLNHDRAR